MTDLWHATASRIRGRLASLRQQHPDDAGEIFEVILLLDTLEQLYRGESAPEVVVKKARQGKTAQSSRTYRRVVEGDQVFLTESRASGQPAYRVSKEVYDAATTVMAKAKKPISFADWHRATQKVVGENCPDYQCRVVLRFWLHVARNALRKVGTRYEACDREAFVGLSSNALYSIDLSE